MASADPTSPEELVVHSSGRSTPPDLRLLHYNDVYHVESGSREPVGGAARFQTVCNYYREDAKFQDQPALMTFFSGDAFNPSLESSVTKGSHMVPVLNSVGTDVACVGNHDLDFGIRQFRYLAKQCTFPWLLSNVTDPALGEDVPLGNAQKYVFLTSSNAIKVGVIGFVEREWLDTINSLPPDLNYKSASATAKELIPKMREEGAEIIIAVTHQREPNDIKLAKNTPPGLIDIILGGHDHFYGHSVVNSTHLLRSGTDFKQLSYIQAWRSKDGANKWEFDIARRDIVRKIPEDPKVADMVEKMTAALRAKLEKPIGYTVAPLDARFTTVRMRESNLANWVADLMRLHYDADCALMAAGTVRGDVIYGPGVIKLKDIMECFPFEDPVVVLRVKGKALREALENGVSQYPALEGRFPQVSNIYFHFDAKAPPHSRITQVKIGNHHLDEEKDYVLSTRGYMAHGKDGYRSLLCKSEGGDAEEIVSEENGVLISQVLRQYFLSIKALGRWKRWGASLHRHWDHIQQDLHMHHPVRESAAPSPEIPAKRAAPMSPVEAPNLGPAHTEVNGRVVDSDTESEDEQAATPHEHHRPSVVKITTRRDRELIIMRKVMRKWWRLAGLPGHPAVGHEEEGEFQVSWTRGIAPRLEGRITLVNG